MNIEHRTDTVSVRTQSFSYHSRRGVLFAAICAAHVLIILALRIGPDRPATVEVRLLQTAIIKERKLEEPSPRLPAASLERPSLKIPIPEIVVAPSPDPPSPIDTGPVGNATTFAAPPAKAPAGIPGTALKFVSAPNSQDYYPAMSSQFGERGVTLLKVCVNAIGKIDGLEVIRSSGFKRLDAAALVVAGKSRWKAATEDGKPAPACTYFFVNFTAGR